jgi:twitching motility protein PilT
MCHINQREVGTHTKGFKNALRAALREDPDIVLVGEMRDPTREQSNLNLGRPGVGIPSPIRTDEFRFSIFRERHQPKTALLQAT